MQGIVMIVIMSRSSSAHNNLPVIVMPYVMLLAEAGQMVSRLAEVQLSLPEVHYLHYQDSLYSSLWVRLIKSFTLSIVHYYRIPVHHPYRLFPGDVLLPLQFSGS